MDSGLAKFYLTTVDARTSSLKPLLDKTHSQVNEAWFEA